MKSMTKNRSTTSTIFRVSTKGSGSVAEVVVRHHSPILEAFWHAKIEIGTVGNQSERLRLVPASPTTEHRFLCQRWRALLYLIGTTGALVTRRLDWREHR